MVYDYTTMIENIIPGYTSYNVDEELNRMLNTEYSDSTAAAVALTQFLDTAYALGYRRAIFKKLNVVGNRIVRQK